ncbi:MAG: hypothetical protein AAF371_10615 [Pseudomonadota bacterium]
MTRGVCDTVRDHLDLVLEDAGKKAAQNIPRPVHVFHVERPRAGPATKARTGAETESRAGAGTGAAAGLAAIGPAPAGHAAAAAALPTALETVSEAARETVPDAAALGGAPEIVALRISVSLNPGSCSTGLSFRGERVHRVRLGAEAGWQPFRNRSGPDIEIQVRAKPMDGGDGLTVSIQPQPEAWRIPDARTVHVPSRTPGTIRHAYSERRAMAPFIGCGRLMAHAELVE